MFFRLLRAGLASVLIVGAGSSAAQQLTNQQLISTLGQITQTAPAVDVDLLMQELNANVGKGVAALPHWSQLARLPQLAVEIDFENNSVAIVPESYRTIGLIADALHDPRLRHYEFLVVGHANATGTAEHNLELTLQRANAIMGALSTTFAVSPNRLVAIGVGQELPLDTANPKAAANRRVQLINVGLAQ